MHAAHSGFLEIIEWDHRVGPWNWIVDDPLYDLLPSL